MAKLNTKTIVLTGTERAVALTGQNCDIQNDSVSVVYVSAEPGIVAGADGVIAVAAGHAVQARDFGGTIYLLGTGTVQVCGHDYQTPVFNRAATSSGEGGGTVDADARKAIEMHAGNVEIHVTAKEREAWNGKAEMSDIPKALPANGGNADTVNGVTLYKSYNEIDSSFNNQTPILDLVKAMKSHSRLSVTVYNGSTSVYPYVSGHLEINKTTTGEYHSLRFTERIATGTKVWNGMCQDTANFWSGWVRSNDGGNADTVDGYHAWELQAVGSDGVPFGHTITANHQADDGRFKLSVAGGEESEHHDTSVDYAYNADTLDGLHAKDFVLKSDYDALVARVEALEGTNNG